VSLDGIYGATWLFNGGAFDQTYVGQAMTVIGTAHNDGAWVVASVLSSKQLTTVATPTPEIFASNVTATFLPAGTLGVVPDTMNDWLLYAELYAAITILDKQNLDSSALKERLAIETKRIQAARAGRRDQPYQAPMRPRRRGRTWGGGGAF
jgi:hypothetical protein